MPLRSKLKLPEVGTKKHARQSRKVQSGIGKWFVKHESRRIGVSPAQCSALGLGAGKMGRGATEQDRNSMAEYEWVAVCFHGKLGRSDAEARLAGKPSGCYLLRLSQTRTAYSLSVADPPRGCRHFAINVEDDKRYRLGTGDPFDTMADLLRHYKVNALTREGLKLSMGIGVPAEPADDEVTYAELQFGAAPGPMVMNPMLFAAPMRHSLPEPGTVPSIVVEEETGPPLEKMPAGAPEKALLTVWMGDNPKVGYDAAAPAETRSNTMVTTAARLEQDDGMETYRPPGGPAPLAPAPTGYEPGGKRCIIS